MFESTSNDNKVCTALCKLLDALTKLAEEALLKIQEEKK